MAVIIRAKEAGLGLGDIRAIIAAPGLAARRATLERHRTDLTRRIAQTRASLDLIEAALGCEHEDVTECPHFRSVAAQRSGVEPGFFTSAGI